MQMIIFKLDERLYGMTTDIVEEISKAKNVTIVPNTPDWIEGLINLRGDAITLINLYFLLEKESEVNYNEIIIMKDKDNEKLGLMVKEIVEVVTIDERDIQSIGDVTQRGIVGVIKIEDEIINVIDINKLISKKEG